MNTSERGAYWRNMNVHIIEIIKLKKKQNRYTECVGLGRQHIYLFDILKMDLI